MKQQYVLTYEQGEKLKEIQTRISQNIKIAKEKPECMYSNILVLEELAAEMEEILVSEYE